ncbi:MAG TPA: YbhB/YbcL family Raf kinase inhibitor-like protein, partial [Geobacteraceae bacterium]
MKKFLYVLTVMILAASFSSAMGKEKKMTGLKISSQAFVHNGYIPARYTCDGNDINPPLEIANVPGEAKSLALIVDDPDAPIGMWV